MLTIPEMEAAAEAAERWPKRRGSALLDSDAFATREGAEIGLPAALYLEHG